MDESMIGKLKLIELLKGTWPGAEFMLPNSNNSPESMEWQKYIEYVHRYVKTFHDLEPIFTTEYGFYKCIANKSDIQKKLDDWLDYCQRTTKDKRKNNDKAKELKEQGNNYFKRKQYPESVKMFTESARYATDFDNCFSTAIANRSAAFFHMCLFKECLLDIELAIKLRYPEGMSWKLHLRAAHAHLKLRQYKLAKDSLAALEKIVESSKELTGTMRETILKQAKDLSSTIKANEKLCENDVPSWKKETCPIPEDMLKKNSIFPFSSTIVRREYSPTRGRYVVAEQSIKKGDILFVEKPFAWVPVTHDNDVSLCAHCSGPIDQALVPCRGCLDALYCNSTCWNDAWSYHQWECPGYHMGLWQQIGVSHLAFKIFMISITTTDIVWFNDVQKLLTNVEKKHVDDVAGLTIASMMLTTYLENYTNFFETVDLKESLIDKFTDITLSFPIDISTKKGPMDYVGSMILRHSLQMLCNAYAVTKLVDSSPSNEGETLFEEQKRIAAGAYPSASMMNHSCDPTVIHTFWNNWLIVKAVKDVRKGEEIFNCYGPYFKRMGKEQRQMDLRNQYCFDCQCSACTNSLFDHYTDRFDGLKCQKCSGSSVRLPSSDSHQCLDCSTTDKITCNDALQKAEKLYSNGIELTDIDKWKEAIPSFERSLMIREKHLYKHNEDVAATLDALGKCYASTSQWLKSISYLERSLAAIEERYGSDSIEVANELNKMTDVCFAYLKRTFSRRSDEYKNTFIKTRKYVDRALLIVTLNAGPWNDKYQEISDKREQLSEMLEQLRI